MLRTPAPHLTLSPWSSSHYPNRRPSERPPLLGWCVLHILHMVYHMFGMARHGLVPYHLYGKEILLSNHMGCHIICLSPILTTRVPYIWYVRLTNNLRHQLYDNIYFATSTYQPNGSFSSVGHFSPYVRSVKALTPPTPLFFHNPHP